MEENLEEKVKSESSKSRWGYIKEIATGTYDGYTVFLPFVSEKVKRKIFGDEKKGIFKEALDYSVTALQKAKNDQEFKGIVRKLHDYFILSGKSRILYDSMSRLDVVGSYEKFWSYFNPLITKRTTAMAFRCLIEVSDYKKREIWSIYYLFSNHCYN